MKIISFDFDNTLTIGKTGIQFLSESLGFQDKMLEFENDFTLNKITTQQFSDLTSSLFKDITINEINAIMKHIPTLVNLRDTIRVLKENDFYCIVNTLTYNFIVCDFAEYYGFNLATGVEMEHIQGKLTGRIKKYFSPYDKKLVLNNLLNNHNSKFLVAVGDSSNDIPMFSIADYKISINSTSADLIKISDANLSTNDAKDILKILMDLK